MSQDTTLKQFYISLIHKRDELKKELADIEITINVINSQLQPSVSFATIGKKENLDSSPKNLQNKLFDYEDLIDKSLSLDEQILQAFHAIDRFIKLKAFVEAFKKNTGTTKDEGYITGVVRRLRRNGLLYTARFNYNDANTFWGLPSFVSNKNGELVIIQHHFPDSKEISVESPYEINKNKKG